MKFVPDAIYHTDMSETPEYIQGWNDCRQAMLAQQPAQQEPVAYLCENAVGHKYFRWKKPSGTYKPIALYTPPQPAQRPWVGLTDGVMCDIAIEHGLMSIDWIDFARAIEAKLKEKNT